jgi:hypothetical protein
MPLHRSTTGRLMMGFPLMQMRSSRVMFGHGVIGTTAANTCQ